jgi:hypothetical protein
MRQVRRVTGAADDASERLARSSGDRLRTVSFQEPPGTGQPTGTRQLQRQAWQWALANRCARTLNLMMAASLRMRTSVQEKAPLVVFQRGLGVRGGGLVVSLP